MRYPKGRRTPKNDGKKSAITVIWAHEPGDCNELTYCWRNVENWHTKEVGLTSCRRDTAILMDAFERQVLLFGKTLKDELIARGYDISTFKFTIEKLIPREPKE